MTWFYADVFGLKAIHESEKRAFLRAADGYDSHTQVVALFNHKFDGGKMQPDIWKTTLHHIAINIPLRDFDAKKRRLKDLGLGINEELHRGSLAPDALPRP